MCTCWFMWYNSNKNLDHTHIHTYRYFLPKLKQAAHNAKRNYLVVKLDYSYRCASLMRRVNLL